MFLRALSVCLTTMALLSACGGGGGVTPGPASAAAPPAPPSATGKLTTLIGSRESAGLHWIIVGDGFTAEQQDELRQAARELATAVLSAPELEGHTGVWNVHLYAVESRESGVDDPAVGRYVNTAFGGTLGCGSNSRVACVDWSLIYGSLLTQGAPNAQLTVILNTPEYVGSSNTTGIIVSRNVHAPAVTLHEMGHRVAGLADEYVDAVVASEWAGRYIEGNYPNVTIATNAAQAPWRHWLVDAGNGVGLYEGAFYSPSGYYRPTENSFMRTLGAPIGKVNTEAWLRAQYRSLPPISSVTPASLTLRGLSGESLDFAVNSAWGDAVELHWLVDHIEDPSAQGARRYHLIADGGMHEVQVIGRDASGQIRAPDATEASSSFTWTVSPAAAPTAGKASINPEVQTWLLVTVDATGHRLLATLPASSPVALVQRRSPAPDWRYSLLDDQGATVANGELDDPRLVHAALSAPGMPPAGHTTDVVDSGVYVVGVPRGVNARKLRIAATAAGAEKLGWTGTVPAGAIELTLDSP